MEATSAADSPKLYRYTFKAGMTCDGCKNAITKLLGTEACKFSASLFNLKQNSNIFHHYSFQDLSKLMD